MNRHEAETLIYDFEDAVRYWEQRPTKQNREDREAAREKLIAAMTQDNRDG